MKKLASIILTSSLLLTSACAGNKVVSKDYSAFNQAAPRSILLAPVVNHSNEVDAADLFLTTLAVPLAERGYYIFPTNTAKKLMDSEGLGDPGLIHQTPTPDMARLFAADAILYVEVIEWKSGYKILSNNVEVEFLYTLKSAKDDAVIWQDQKRHVFSTSSNSGNIFADLIVNAIKGAIDSTKRDFTPVAQEANLLVLTPAGTGVPFGPRSPHVKKNGKFFAVSGTGSVTNATRQALSAPGLGPINAEK